MMILGDIDNFEWEWFSSLLQKALSFIKKTDFHGLKAGKYEIDGDNMFAQVQEVTTANKDERMAECHSKYIDLQYLVYGEETIYVARPSEQNVIVDNQMESKDIAFFNRVQNESEINLNPGMFAVLFPNDIHRPSCSKMKDTNIKKVVIKIKI